jgi:HSP20 family protein
MLYRSQSPAPAFSLRREIDRLFDDAFGGAGARGGTMPWAPAVDVREDDKSLTFEFELPGLRPEQVEITADNGVLTVHGEKQSQRSENEGRHHIVERTYGTFTRSFQLPQGMDDENIEAQFDNGVLTVHVPKSALPQPRRIQIKGAGASQGNGGRKQQVSSRSGTQTQAQPQSQPETAGAQGR